MGVSAADEREEIGVPDIRRLQEAPTILNLMGQPTHPDEVLLQDSEWHAGFFNGEGMRLGGQLICNEDAGIQETVRSPTVDEGEDGDGMLAGNQEMH